MKKLLSLLCFLFAFTSIFLMANEDVSAESGTFRGVLSSAEGGYTITNDQGGSVKITYTRDLSSWIGSQVEMTYTGSLQDTITITDFKLLNSDGTTTPTHTPLNTNFGGIAGILILSSIVVILGLVLIINGKSYINKSV